MLKLCYHFSSSSVCEKEEGQSNYTWVHPSCEFHSWNLGTSNTSFFPVKFWFWKLLSVCAYVMPTWAGFHNNCLPFGLHFCHLPCHIIIIILIIIITTIAIIIIIFNHHHFFLLGVSSLGWAILGRSLFFNCRCLQRGAEDEKIQSNSCASCHSSPTVTMCFQHSKLINFGLDS